MSQTIGHPLVPLGTLNRARANVQIVSYANLNVTSSYLGKEGISISWDGDSAKLLPQMIGAVPSLEPYQMMTVKMQLMKSQALAAQYEAQRLSNSLLGDIIVTLDTSTMPQYPASQTVIMNVEQLSGNGEDAAYMVTLMGVYYINNSMFNAF